MFKGIFTRGCTLWGGDAIEALLFEGLFAFFHGAINSPQRGEGEIYICKLYLQMYIYDCTVSVV